MPAPMVPARMARKVPISTRALPPTSSCSRRAAGRIEYFTGPNSAEWVPMANSAASIRYRLSSRKPPAPTSMITTSASLIARISASLANFSPNWPPSAENRKNGRMNSNAQRLTSRSRSALTLSLNRMARISDCLKMLSLNAPSNWVMKNGRKRRVPSRANCEFWVIVLVPVRGRAGRPILDSISTRQSHTRVALSALSRRQRRESDGHLPQPPAQQEERQQPATYGRQQMAGNGGDGDGRETGQQIGVVQAQVPLLPVRQQHAGNHDGAQHGGRHIVQPLTHQRRKAQIGKGEQAVAGGEGDHQHAEDQHPVVHQYTSSCNRR